MINKIAGRFSTMIEELDEGVVDCRAKQKDISTQIESLHQRDTILNSSVQQAAAIASSLRNVLGR